MVKSGTASRGVTEDAEASSKLCEQRVRRSLKLKTFVVYFKQLDLGPPTGGCPNQIVLVGRSPALCLLGHTNSTVIFHVQNNKSLILM